MHLDHFGDTNGVISKNKAWWQECAGLTADAPMQSGKGEDNVTNFFSFLKKRQCMRQSSDMLK